MHKIWLITICYQFHCKLKTGSIFYAFIWRLKMAKESTQHKLDRVRPPRVQITYDVEIGDAIEKKELPFVVGVVGDFSGNPEEPLPKLRDRKFVNVDRDNFNSVMEGMKPRVAYRVDNKLTDDEDSQLPVELNFKKLDDFSPENVAKQVEPLRRLLEIRSRLTDLRNRLYGNDKLDEQLREVIQNTDKLKQIASETGYETKKKDKE